MTQDELKQAVAKAAIDYVPAGTIVGVGTGSTANFFIDELAKIKGKIDGTVASSVASADRLKGHGIPVYDLNAVDGLSVMLFSSCSSFIGSMISQLCTSRMILPLSVVKSWRNTGSPPSLTISRAT